MVATIFEWKYGGNSVLLCGSFSYWKKKEKMNKSSDGRLWTLNLDLCPGTYTYKFIVDGVWKYDEKVTLVNDGSGNTNNMITVWEPSQDEELSDSVESVEIPQKSPITTINSKNTTISLTNKTTQIISSRTVTPVIPLPSTAKNPTTIPPITAVTKADITETTAKVSTPKTSTKETKRSTAEEIATPVPSTAQSTASTVPSQSTSLSTGPSTAAAEPEPKPEPVNTTTTTEETIPCSVCSLSKTKKDFSRNQTAKPLSVRKCNTCVSTELKQVFMCASCKEEKTRNSFSQKQFLREERKCRVCNMKNVAQRKQKEWLMQHGVQNVEEKVPCSLCGVSKPKLDFMNSQLKRKEKRICILCLSGRSIDIPPPDTFVPELFKPIIIPKLQQILKREEELIEEWTEQLALLKKEISELKHNLEEEYVGHQHKTRRKNAREQLSQNKLKKSNLKEEIQAAKAILHLQQHKASHSEQIETLYEKWLKSPFLDEFSGKYTFANEDEGNLSLNQLCLNSGNSCTLRVSQNNTKSFGKKSGYCFLYEGKYFIENSDPTKFILRGILSYPDIKKIHNARQGTQPPRYRPEFFSEFISEGYIGILEGNFSKDDRSDVSICIHYGALCCEENEVLVHYFEKQEFSFSR